MRRAAFGALAALAALPAAAQEGGLIRTGEHADFTRVVMVIEPTTEWSLETGDGAATIFFPGRALDFDTGRAFERIPRTRVTAIETAITEAGTRVAVAIDCACRISASFVGGRYLALDIGGRDAPPPPAPRAEDREARALREARAVAAAELALAAQIDRAADQGLVRFGAGRPRRATGPGPAREAAAATAPDSGGADSPATDPADDADDAAATPAADETVAAPAADETVAAPAADETVAAPAPLAAASPAAEGAVAPQTLADLALHEQIEATSVFDRDGAALAGRRPAPPPPAVCIADEALDAGRWTSGAPLHAQTPALMRRVLGEFDRPDPQVLRDLARLYIRFGFGAEAEALLASLEAGLEDRALLDDLARVVEGRPVAPDGPLALIEPCPGRHGLFLALGGSAPAFHDAAHFGSVQAAFADLPPDLRALLAPRLVVRLIDAGRPDEARLIKETATRPGVRATDELRLAEARLLGAEGRVRDAVATLRPLAESNAPDAVEALALMTRLAVDHGLALPDRTLTDLRSAALQQRGAQAEAELRGLLIEALAQRGALAEAVAELRAARAELPAADAAFRSLGQAALGAADPERIGASAYAQAVLAATDLLSGAADGDGVRAAIAGRLIAIGLPNAAQRLLAPPLSRNDATSRLLAARAHLALGREAEALAALEALDGPEALRLRAAALGRSGAPEAALALLDGAGALDEALPYAWRSGDWERVRGAEDDPERVAMAGYMAARGRSGPNPAPAEAPLTGAEAFLAPLPRLDAPSLRAARSLLSTGQEIATFLDGLIRDD